MRFVVILSCIFLPYIRTNDLVSDDAAATDEKHFGKDMYCHFAFGGATDPDHMRLVNSANAEIYGIARLPVILSLPKYRCIVEDFLILHF